MDLMPFQREGVADLLSWIGTEAELVQWAGSAFAWPLTEAEFRRHLQAADQEPPTLYPCGLYERERMVGYCELSDHRRRAHSAMLSRVIVSPDLRGRRWGQYLVQHALAWGFEQLKLHRIGLGVFDFNKSAIACYEKVGFVCEGRLRENTRVGDTYWSCHIMSILSHEWQAP